MVVKMMSLANPTIQLITDGGVQFTVKMRGWSESKRRPEVCDVFDSGYRIKDGKLEMHGIRIAPDQVNFQEMLFDQTVIDDSGEKHVLDAIVVEGKKLYYGKSITLNGETLQDARDYLAQYSLDCVMDMFPEYFKVIGEPGFESKELVNVQGLVFDGATNYGFDVGTDRKPSIKRRGASYGKDRVVHIEGDSIKNSGGEPVLEMLEGMCSDGRVTIQSPHIETGILKLGKSKEKGFVNSDLGCTLFKLTNTLPQVPGISYKNHKMWKNVNSVKTWLSQKTVLGATIVGVDFSVKDELVVDMNVVNEYFTKIQRLEDEKCTVAEMKKVLKVDYRKLIKHKPYMDYVRAFLETSDEVDELNGYHRREPRTKVMNKAIFDAL